jgi:Histidine kinase-, DNA gyrase B-, and HSP90-like ATPase
VSIHAEVFQKNAKFVLVKISDTGCGLDAEMTERVFERLYQVPTPALAGRKGLGLGLYICKELINRMNGHIWAESEPGYGTSFSFILPIFSLEDLIAPILVHRDRSIDTVAVMEVEITNSKSSHKIPENVSRAVTHRLQRCLLPDLDVLLPKLRSDAGAETMLVIAAANEKGADVMVKRIHEQLEQCQELHQTGFHFTVSYQLLNVDNTEPNIPIEHFLRKVTTGIEGIINSVYVGNNYHHV